MDGKFALWFDIADEPSSDKRQLCQDARFVLTKSKVSPWAQTLIARGRMPSPLSLIRVRDMAIIGNSPGALQRKLGPGERIQQRGVPCTVDLLHGFLERLPAGESDALIVCNLIPADVDEFAQACFKMCATRPTSYVTVVKKLEVQELQVSKLLSVLLSDWWDCHPEAGAWGDVRAIRLERRYS